MKPYSLFVLLFFLHFSGLAQTTFEELTNKAYISLEEGNAVAARQYMEKAKLVLPEKLGLHEKAIFYNDLGVTYYQTGEYKKGIDQYRIAINFYRAIGNDSLTAESILNLGLAYKEIGLYGSATKEFIQSARIFEREGYKQALASTWNAMGNIQREMGDFEKAIHYHQQALQIRKKIHYEKGIADSYHNIGYVYIEQKQYNKAEYYLDKALRYKRKLGNKPNLITTLTLLGEVYVNKGETKKALSLLNEAYDLRLEAGNSSKTAFSLLYLGSYYAKTGDQTKAYATYRQAQELARSSDDYPVLIDALWGEIHLLRMDQNNDLLVKKYEKLLRVQQWLAKEVSQKEIAKLEIAYDVERKNRELESRRKQAKLDKIQLENHRLRNQQMTAGLVLSFLFIITITFAWMRLRKSNRRIERQKQEITYLHHELSHRTKNYFGLLSGMLSADRRSTQNEETIRLLDENILRLEALSLVQRYLLDDSTRNQKEIRLDAYLSELVDILILHLFPKGDKLQLEKDIAPIYLDYDKAMRLAIALNELVCNAIEHGLNTIDEPTLLVSVKQKGNQLTMTVRDNGAGISEHAIASRQTKGLDLIPKLLQKMDGKIEYRNEHGCVASIMVCT